MIRPHLLLASASPRRRDLLAQAGVTFTVRAAEVDESVLPGEQPVDYARRLAQAKARAVAGGETGWILGADTVVTLGTRILGKPVDRRDAEDMLAALSGRVHQVVTAYCLLHAGEERMILEHCITDVAFRRLSPRDVARYCNTGEPFDKAGAYAIQGVGGGLVAWLNGSYTNVVGLPLERVLDCLDGL